MTEVTAVAIAGTCVWLKQPVSSCPLRTVLPAQGVRKEQEVMEQKVKELGSVFRESPFLAAVEAGQQPPSRDQPRKQRGAFRLGQQLQSPHRKQPRAVFLFVSTLRSTGTRKISKPGT